MNKNQIDEMKHATRNQSRLNTDGNDAVDCLFNTIKQMTDERDKWLRVGSEIIEELDAANSLLQHKDEEIKQLTEERNALLDILKRMDALIDFGEPIEPGEEFYDPSGINQVYSDARSIIAKIEGK